MLFEISCDSFAEEHRTVTFGGGLNTVLGSNGGSNAIGKSTFLWMVDYAFGGTAYNDIWKDIAQHIGKHPVRFTFQFDGQLHYFFRTLEEPRTVCRCDKKGKIIDKLTLDKYRKWLLESYGIVCDGIAFQDLTSRFDRIYGADNTYEKTPYLQKPKEAEDKAVDFLIRLYGGNDILEEIAAAEAKLGVKASEFVEKKQKPIDTSKIEENNKTIESLKERLDKLTQQEEDAQLAFFGFDTETFERLSRLRKELQTLVRRRNRLKSQLNAISEVEPYAEGNIKSEFDELKTFFPDADIKSFEEIEGFHKKIRRIIGDEASEEVKRLTAVISQCDAEIASLRDKIEKSGLAKEMSARTVSQCVSVSRKIDALTEENEELLRQKELQDARAKAEAEMKALIERQRDCISEIEAAVNQRIIEINRTVTGGRETAPKLRIFDDKMIRYKTEGNTSEGTAFKSMVIYDLALATLFPVPFLIHDSNIIKRIGDDHLEHILKYYQTVGKQVFIAFDKADSVTDTAKNILESTAVLTLNDGNELYGKSWTKKK